MNHFYILNKFGFSIFYLIYIIISEVYKPILLEFSLEKSNFEAKFYYELSGNFKIFELVYEDLSEEPIIPKSIQISNFQNNQSICLNQRITFAKKYRFYLRVYGNFDFKDSNYFEVKTGNLK